MTHLSVDQLVMLREPGVEPGVAGARAHLEGCGECQEELRRLDQRAARLKALATLRPARDQWAAIEARVRAERRVRRLRIAGMTVLATAAALALMVLTRRGQEAQVTTAVAIGNVVARSHQLEQVLEAYNPERRVTDGVTAVVAGELEDRIAVVDRRLEQVQLRGAARRDEQLLRLWQERVGLLDALVDVHLTRASNVGF